MNENLFSLRELCSHIDYGLTASASSEMIGPRFLRITDIVNSPGDYSQVPYVNSDSVVSSKYLLERGDIVIARTGATVGASHWYEGNSEPVAFASYLVRFRVRDGVNSRFIAYGLKSANWQRFINANAHSKSAQPNIGASAMAEFRITVPSPLAQRAVAEILGALDDKVSANLEAASKARELAVALIGAVASSMKLGELAGVVRKSVNPSSLGINAVKHFSLPNYDSGSAATESPSGIKSAKNLLQEPVVLVSKLNPRIPRIWAVDRLPVEPALASTEFVALAPRKVGTGSLWAALLEPRFTRSLLERTAGTTGSHQRVKPEQMLDVDVPDVRELQSETKDLLESLCRKVNDVADENQRLAATRDELLPLLMSGKITVKDAEKTVEEVV